MQTSLNHCLKTQILFPQRFLCCDTTLMICRNQISQRDLQSVYIANIFPTCTQSAVPYLLKIWNTLSMPYFAITRSPWIHLYFSKSVFFTFFFFFLRNELIIPVCITFVFFLASLSYPGFIQQIAIIFKDFPRTSFDFHGLPTRNVHHRFVHVDTFPECLS